MREAPARRADAPRMSSAGRTTLVGKEYARKKRSIVDVVIATVTGVEYAAVLERLDPLQGETCVLQINIDGWTYDLGRLGGTSVALSRSAPGSATLSGALQSATHALQQWRPRAIIMVGIAFGKDPQQQQIGDVLISERVICYEHQRIGAEQTVLRGPIVEAGPKLLRLFKSAHQYGLTPRVHYGALLSGDKLVDNAAFKASLFRRYPQAIGGDMEAAGLYAAAHNDGTEWLVVKAIADWGDGFKNDDHQSTAAAAAVAVIYEVLSVELALASFPRRRSASGRARAARALESTIHNISLERNPAILSRPDVLTKISAGYCTSHRVVLTGMGGVGKTQAALEYAYKSLAAKTYDVVWWLRSAENDASGELIDLARRLNEKRRRYTNVLLDPESVPALLDTYDTWLLIVDDIMDPRTVESILPWRRLLQGHRHLLITSQNQLWPPEYVPVAVETLTELSSLELLELSSGTRMDRGVARREMAGVAADLGFLPLALVQAGAYVRECRISFGDYRRRFQADPIALMNAKTSGEKQSVARTIKLSVEVLLRAEREIAKIRPSDDDGRIALVAFLLAVLAAIACAFLTRKLIPAANFVGVAVLVLGVVGTVAFKLLVRLREAYFEMGADLLRQPKPREISRF